MYRRRLNFSSIAPGTAKLFRPLISFGPGGVNAYLSNGDSELGSAVSGSYGT